MPSPKESLFRLAMGQHGVFSRAQAVDLGVDSRVLRRMTQGGSILPCGKVLRLASCESTPFTGLWTAVLETGGVLSHGSARRVTSGEFPEATTEVTVPYGRRSSPSPGITVHHSRRLPKGHITRDAHGLPMTVPPRTFIDLAAPATGLTDTQLISCLDAWIVSGQITLNWLEWFVATQARQLHGRQRAVGLLQSVGGLRVESHAERDLADLLTRARLTPFLTQYPIRLDGAIVARVDFAWPHHRVALELDGYRFHSGPGVFVADRQRGNEVELAGWKLLRTTPTEVRRDPRRLTTIVQAAVAAPETRTPDIVGDQ
ncbi:MAG: DUF559 domain-containing protein [Acidimicrobiales bacterium]